MLCIGHRGAAGYEPENTIRSIERALDLGAEWIEVDVYLVEDALVVIHDDTLERTTNGRGLLSQCSLDYIRSLDAGGGERVPLIEEVVAAVNNRAGLNIELKGPETAVPVAKLVLELIAKGWSYDDLLVSSFDHDRLRLAKSVAPQLHLGVLVDKHPHEFLDLARELGAYSINPSFRSIDSAFVEAAHTAGLKVFAYTVNEPQDLQRMLRLGIDGAFCDFPDRLCRERTKSALRAQA